MTTESPYCLTIRESCQNSSEDLMSDVHDVDLSFDKFLYISNEGSLQLYTIPKTLFNRIHFIGTRLR